jgi:hypothetical protein
MYQPLIWAAVVGDDSRRLASALDSKDVERAPDTLVDGVRGDVELGRYLLGIEVFVDEPQAVELPCAQSCDASYQVFPRWTVWSSSGVRHARPLLQCHPHGERHGSTFGSESSV